MSEPVTNPAGLKEPRPAVPAGVANAKAPLPDLFAELLNRPSFAVRMMSVSEIELSHAAERAYEVRRDAYETEPERAETESVDDTTDRVSDTDDGSREDDPADDRPGGARDGSDTDTSAQAAAAPDEDALLALKAAGHDGDNPGLTAQPNAMSGIALHDRVDGPTPGQPRAVKTSGGDIAAVHNQAGANAAQAKAAPGQDQAGANGPQTDAAAQKTDANGAVAGGDRSAKAATAAQPQNQAAAAARTDGLATSPEQQILLARDTAKLAAELHNMKVRLSAHQQALKKAVAQSQNAAQVQPPANSAGKPVIDVATNATPMAPAASDGPAARPAGLFAASPTSTLPSQAGANGLSHLAAGDTAMNTLEQSAPADRQLQAPSTSRGPNLRPALGQPAYSPAEQVKVHIQQLVKTGADRIQIKLSPASLGRVEVALEVAPDKAVHAIVYAENPDTLDMLERDARVLKEALEQAGMKFDSDGLTFKHGQPGNADSQLADDTQPSETGMASDAEGDELSDAAADQQPQRRQHDGVLDLEI